MFSAEQFLKNKLIYDSLVHFCVSDLKNAQTEHYQPSLSDTDKLDNLKPTQNFPNYN
jgi:hypothetical protein